MASERSAELLFNYLKSTNVWCKMSLYTCNDDGTNESFKRIKYFDPEGVQS